MNIKYIFKHLHTINKHKYYVCKNCFKAGLYKRGILHDLSKYSPTEFFESVKYYTGTHSPIDECKKENQWSKAWMHHKGRNRHHWEYWIDNIYDGSNISAILMPYEFAVEMLCDYIGAGQAYQGKDWTPQSEYIWWNKKKANVFMHPGIYNFINHILFTMADLTTADNYKIFLEPRYLKVIYNWTSIQARYVVGISAERRYINDMLC